jgi:hypothetical protein
MASTQITVENWTDVPIYALLTFGGGHIGLADIQASQKPPTRSGAEGTGHHRETYPSGAIPCEYVYYDPWILDHRYGLTRDGTGVVGGTTLVQKQARGGSSWRFEGTGEQGYRLVDSHTATPGSAGVPG